MLIYCWAINRNQNCIKGGEEGKRLSVPRSRIVVWRWIVFQTFFVNITLSTFKGYLLNACVHVARKQTPRIENITAGDVPGHLWVLHSLVSILVPLHTLSQTEAINGDEAIHTRMRSCMPELHDLLHWPQSPHMLHPKNAAEIWGG